MMVWFILPKNGRVSQPVFKFRAQNYAGYHERLRNLSILYHHFEVLGLKDEYNGLLKLRNLVTSIMQTFMVKFVK